MKEGKDGFMDENQIYRENNSVADGLLTGEVVADSLIFEVGLIHSQAQIYLCSVCLGK